MEKTIITFSANEQCLQKTGGIDCYASNTVAYIEARFDLGENWSGYDSVRAVWWNDYNKTVATVLDSDESCIVPYEVLTRKGAVKVNLVGSIAENDVLTDRLTTCPVIALTIKCNAKTDGDNTQPITPSEYEQFVGIVKADADRAEAGAESAEASAQSASESATASANSATSSAQSATASAQSAQNASESAQSAENAKDDAEDARDKILGMRATATTLEAGSDATASYSDGLLTLGIPRGDQGIQGIQGETGATPNLTIGTVETLEPTEDATASITGTAENPVLNLGIPKGEQGDVNLSQLEALLPTETASGEIVTITDGQSVVPAKSLKVALDPIQDLHGYDKPWAAGAGANLLNADYAIKFTLSKTITLPQTILNGTKVYIHSDAFSYTTPPSSGNKYPYYVFRGANNENRGQIWGFSDSSVTLSGDAVAIELWSNGYDYGASSGVEVTISGLTISKTEQTTWTPYSNICPISGRTEVVTQRTGKNLLNPSLYKFQTATRNGLTYTVNNDGTISVTGTVTATGGPSLTDYFYLPAGTYSFIEETSQNVYCAYRRIPSGQSSSSALASPFTTDGNDRIYINLYSKVSSGNIDLTIHPQIEAGSTSSEFEPYEAETYTTSLGRTVYGGTLDVVSGELVVDRAMVDLGSLNWGYSTADRRFYNNTIDYNRSNPNAICSQYQSVPLGSLDDGKLCAYSNGYLYIKDYRYTDAQSFKTAMDGVQFCYELATPTTYQLTPQEVQLLLGKNNVWSDGDVTMTYNADIQRYIDKKLSGNSTTSMLSMSRPMVQTETTETEETETETAETE